MLILVRHAMPAYTRDMPPHEWDLGEDGHACSIKLAEMLPANAVLVASAETKAAKTLDPAATGARAVTRDLRFNEVDRVESWGGEFDKLRQDYLAGVDHPGWEPRDHVAERFGGAIVEHLARAGPRPLVVATHGMAMTVWLQRRIGLPDPVAFWTGLRLPDARIVDLSRGTIDRLGMHGVPGLRSE